MEITLARTLEELRALKDQIHEIAENSHSRNPFYSASMLLSAFEHLNEKRDVIVLIIWLADKERIGGVFPLQQKIGYRRFPIKYYSMWKHSHCFLSTPLLRTGHEQEVLESFFNWLKTESLGRYLFEFEQMAADDSFQENLKKYLTRNRLRSDALERYQRPILRSSLSAEGYLNQAVSGKHMKDLRKKLQKLEQLGVVGFKLLSPEDNLEEWIQSFLGLEQSGWKGRANSAIACDEAQSEYFSCIVRDAHNEDRLIFMKMTLDDQPIAMRCGFRDGECLFSFKIAFDEQYGKYSPGVLLEMEHLRYIQDKQSRVRWVDSCAVPNHPMLGRLLKESRAIASVAVGMDNIWGNNLVRLASYLKSLKDLAQGRHASPFHIVKTPAIVLIELFRII